MLLSSCSIFNQPDPAYAQGPAPGQKRTGNQPGKRAKGGKNLIAAASPIPSRMGI